MVAYQVNVRLIYKLLIPFLCISCSVIGKQFDGFNFSAGIMQRQGAEASIVKEGFEIPFVTISEDLDYGFGYRIDSKRKQSFRHRVILHVPKKSKLTGDTPNNIKYSDQSKAIAYPEETVEEFTHVFIRLDEDDLPGIYEVESYINGELYKKLRFNVIKIKEDQGKSKGSL
jgi:hypothetical protein